MVKFCLSTITVFIFKTSGYNVECDGLWNRSNRFLYLGPWESYDEWSRNPRAWHTKRFGSKTFEDIFQVIKPVPRDRWNTWNFQYGDVANIAEWRKWADQN